MRTPILIWESLSQGYVDNVCVNIVGTTWTNAQLVMVEGKFPL